MFHVVLFQPENAGNIGNIIRTCYIHNAALHLIRPYGWIGNLRYIKNYDLIDSKHAEVLRSSVDCFDKIAIHEHDTWDDFLASQVSDNQTLFFSKHGAIALQTFYQNHKRMINGAKHIYLVFGSETFGLNKLTAKHNLNPCIMLEPIDVDKCHNLSNAVAICLHVFDVLFDKIIL